MNLKKLLLLEISLIVLLCLTNSQAASYLIKHDVRQKKSITPQSSEFVKLKKQLSKSSIANPLNVQELFDNAVFDHPEDPFEELRG